MSGGSSGGGGGGGGGGTSLGGIAAILGVILVGYAALRGAHLPTFNDTAIYGQTMPTSEAIEQGPFTIYPGKEFEISGLANYCLNGVMNADKLVNLNTEPRNKRYVFKFKLREDIREETPVTFVLYKKGTNGCRL